MKKNVKKILMLIFIITIIGMSFKEIQAVEHVIDRVEKHATTSAMQIEEVEIKAGEIINLMQTIGIILGVAILIVIGIKFILGSAEEKAEYKKSFLPLIVGAFILMSAFPIARFVFSVFSN